MNQPILPIELVIATSTRKHGSMRKAENRSKFIQEVGLGSRLLIIPEQVHGNSGNSVAYIGDASEDRKIDGVDALYTDNKGVALGVLHADCYPVCIWSLHDGIVNCFGIAHAGFNGIAHGDGFQCPKLDVKDRSPRNFYGVLESLLSSLHGLLRSNGGFLDDEAIYSSISSFIGPGICQIHYEIKDNQSGLGRFSKYSDYRKLPFLSYVDGHKMQFFLDLRAIIENQLRAGMPKDNLIGGAICNYCGLQEYYSYRAGDKDDRNMTIIGIR